MPSEMMNRRGLPQSLLAEEGCFPDERQIGVWKMDQTPSCYGLKMGSIFRTTDIISSPTENRNTVNPHILKAHEHPEHYRIHGRFSSGKQIVEVEGAASRSLPSAIGSGPVIRKNMNIESKSNLFDADKINLMGFQHENSLFSSSTSDIFCKKLIAPSDNVISGHSISASAIHNGEEEVVESLEELEALTIGNLLPDDDDLLSGVMDGFDSFIPSNDLEDMEDMFSNVGGLELGGEEGSSPRKYELFDVKPPNNEMGAKAGASNWGERPSRTLVVRNLNSSVEDYELRMVFEQFGDIQTLYTASKHQGLVMISYYDIRAACSALKALQNKTFKHRKLDIHFSIPKNPLEKDINQGTLLIFHLDSTVSNDDLREIFGVYGEVKEIRETLHGSDHKYVEFYDNRAAEDALHAVNRSELSAGKIKLGSSLLGGSQRLMQQDSGHQLQQHSPSIMSTVSPGSLSIGGNAYAADNGTVVGPPNSLLENVYHSEASSVASNSIPSIARIETGYQSLIVESGHPRNHLKFDLQSINTNPRSLPGYYDGLVSGNSFGSPNQMAVNISSRSPEMFDNQKVERVCTNELSFQLNEGFGSSGNGSCPPPGRHFMWNKPHHQQAQPIAWPNSPSFVNGIGAGLPPNSPSFVNGIGAGLPPNSPSFVNGIGAGLPQHMHAVPRGTSHMMDSLLPQKSHHVGSAPSINVWDRHSYAGESPDGSVFLPGSLGNMRISGNSPHPMEFLSHNMFPLSAGNCVDPPITSRTNGLHAHLQRCMLFPTGNQMIPFMGSFDSSNERPRNRRNESSITQVDNKRQFELDLDRIVRGEDTRTTLMIKNIPNKYTSKMLLAAIDERHKGTYDFIYLPIDFKNKCNVGYAFINMTDPSLIIPFYQTINGKKWEKFNSEKVATLAYARIQGKVSLIAHFQNSSLMNEDKRCRPILFHTGGPNAGDQVPFPMGTNIRPRPVKSRGIYMEESNSDILPIEEFSVGDLAYGSGKDSD